jgi:hypothetical protein
MRITNYGFKGLLERNEEETPHDTFFSLFIAQSKM